MSRLRFEHVAGRYYVAPSFDLTQEPVFPGDVAEVGITHWEVCADAERDARGNWTYQWIENYDTEDVARAVARRLAELPCGRQHHGSVDDQLLDTADLAARLGMDDAASFILARVERCGLTSSAYVDRLERLRGAVFEQAKKSELEKSRR